MENTNEIIIYQPDNAISLNVRIENETVWLNRHQMALLFDRDIKTIGKHIQNALSEELAGMTDSVVANFATTAADGKVYQTEHYNIELITSIGYRVKSSRGVQFRVWANKVLKEYLLHGYAINQRFERLEYRVAKTEEAVDFFVKTALPPHEGVFFDGQIFDAYQFVCDLVRLAKRRIILIDNYVDETVLSLLAKREKGVSATIYTQKIPHTLALDLKRHNAQYSPIKITEVQGVHDRFLIIDDVVYHIGASIKDLGKKLFAFSKMELPAEVILERIHAQTYFK